MFQGNAPLENICPKTPYVFETELSVSFQQYFYYTLLFRPTPTVVDLIITGFFGIYCYEVGGQSMGMENHIGLLHVYPPLPPPNFTVMYKPCLLAVYMQVKGSESDSSEYTTRAGNLDKLKF